MKPIIKETLKKKQGIDKALYFLYAYKEYFIGILVAFAILLFVYFGYASRTEVILDVKIMTESNQDAGISLEMEKAYNDLLKPAGKEKVQVDISNLDDPQSQQVFANQLAAREIDIIWMQESYIADFIARYDNDDITASDLSFEKDGITYVARIIPKAPHQEAIKKVMALYRK